MEKNNESALDKFLGESLDVGEQNPFAQQESFTPQEEVEEIVEKEEKLPFNKDPKLQKYIDKEIAKRLEKYTVQEVKEVVKDREPLVDEDYYIRLIGNDTPEKLAMIKESMARDERMLSAAEERAMSRLSERDYEAVRADQEAEEELSNALESIEENFDVDITSTSPLAKKQRNEFISFVEKIAPKDRNGDIVEFPDMLSAWETFSEMKQSTPSRAKEVASRSMARSTNAEPATQPKRVTFDDADAFIASLK